MADFDWRNIAGFKYRFDIDDDSKYAKQLKRLNGRYTGNLRVEDAMFITASNGTRSLIANPLNYIRKQIATEIAEIRGLQDAEEQLRLEAHLAILLDSSMILGIGVDGDPTSIRNGPRLTDLAEDVSIGGGKRLQLVLTTEQWRFKKGWKLHLFSKIQLDGHSGETSEESDTNEKDSDDDSSKSPSTSPATNDVDDRLTKILEEQQILIADLAQRTNSTPPSQANVNQVGQQLPISDLHWTSNELPNPVLPRFNVRKTYLSHKQMEPFTIENKDANGIVISTVDMNHYLNTKRGTNLQKLITRSVLKA